MKNLVVLYGGTSCERDISVLTGVQAAAAADKKRYCVYPVFWSAGDRFYVPDKYSDLERYAKSEYDGGREVVFYKDTLCYVKKNKLKPLCKVDCVLICTHGGRGENGALQGYFQTLGIPYTSPDVLACAVGMDKDIFKAVCKKLSLPLLPYVTARESEDRGAVVKKASKLGYPLIVKPASQGSSIGINVCKDEKELEDALDTAYEYDDKAVIEKALDDFREINCACVKIGGEILPSTLEEPVVWRDFLSFEDKYMSGKKGNGDRKVRDFPAQLDEKTGCDIQNMTAKVYAALALKGIVRCDYLIDRASGKVYFNEINTIPGSLAGYLYTDKGLTLKEIITETVEECISTKRGAKEKGYSSGVLQYYAKGGSNACKSGAKKV